MASGDMNSTNVNVAHYLHRGLSGLFRQDIITDFEVIVGDKTFRCHKVVLAAVSDYFQSMFTSRMKEAVENKSVLKDVEPEVFESILDIVYDGSREKVCALSKKGMAEMEEYLRIAGMLQIQCLQDICLKYFKAHLNVHNCIAIWKIGNTLQMKSLQIHAWRYIRSHFEDLASDDLLLTLEFNDLKALIEDRGLKVRKEEMVCNVVLSWVNFEKTREDKLKLLLDCCYLNELDVNYLVEELSFHPQCRKYENILETVKHALRYKFHKDLHGNISLSFRPCRDLEQIPILLGKKTSGTWKSLGYTSRLQHWMQLEGPPRDTGIDFACCVYGNSLYLAGGECTRDTLRYDGETGIWTRLKDIYLPLTKHTMTAHNDHLYVFGGVFNRLLNKNIIVYSIENNDWNIADVTLIVLVHSASSVLLGQKIYIVGGVLEDLIVVTDIVQVYDTATKSCSLFCHLPSPCSFSRAVCDTNNIFVVTSKGGIVKFNGSSSEAEPEVICNIPEFNRFNFGAVLRNNILSISGGVLVEDTSKVCKNVYKVDLLSGDVSPAKALPKAYEVYGSLVLVVNTVRI